MFHDAQITYEKGKKYHITELKSWHKEVLVLQKLCEKK